MDKVTETRVDGERGKNLVFRSCQVSLSMGEENFANFCFLKSQLTLLCLSKMANVITHWQLCVLCQLQPLFSFPCLTESLFGRGSISMALDFMVRWYPSEPTAYSCFFWALEQNATQLPIPGSRGREELKPCVPLQHSLSPSVHCFLING